MPSYQAFSSCHRTAGISRLKPTSISPKPAVLGIYVVAIFVSQIGYCLLLVLASKAETKVRDKFTPRNAHYQHRYPITENTDERRWPLISFSKLGHGGMGCCMGESEGPTSAGMVSMIYTKSWIGRSWNGSFLPQFCKEFLLCSCCTQTWPYSSTTRQHRLGHLTPLSSMYHSASFLSCP